jgi:hypothetical protein
MAEQPNFTKETKNGQSINRRASTSATSMSSKSRISELNRADFLQDDDILVISRYNEGTSEYDETFGIQVSDTNLSSSIDSGGVPIEDLRNVDIPEALLAGGHILAFNGENWTNYSWEYLNKDKFQILEGSGPPEETCDGGEWKEITKIFACQKSGKFVFYFQVSN